VGELFTLKGKVTGTGDYTFTSDLIYGTITLFRIPRGMRAKVWCKRISGEAAELYLRYSHDVTVSPISWVDISFEKLASPGELWLEKRRPIVLRSEVGKEGFKLERVTGTGDSHVEIEVEIEEDVKG